MKRLVSLLAVLLLPLVALARSLLIPPKHIKTTIQASRPRDAAAC